MDRQKKLILIGFGIMAAIIVALSFLSYKLYADNVVNSGEITALNKSLELKSTEVQQFSEKLGIAESTLATQKSISEAFKKDLDSMSKDFKNLRRKYKLDLSSRDAMIAQLQSQITGGNTEVVVTDNPDATKKIEYSWSDTLKRFALHDPDIFVKNNEKFDYKLNMSVTGYVFRDKSGKLQTRKVEVQEVVPQFDGKTTKYVPVPGSQVAVVQNNFVYSDPKPDERTPMDIWDPGVFVMFDTQLQPGVGVQLLDAGNYFDYLNFGLDAQVSFDVDNNFTELANSSVGLGIHYKFARPIIDTNIGLGVGVLTPINGLLNQWIFSANIEFYLTN